MQARQSCTIHPTIRSSAALDANAMLFDLVINVLDAISHRIIVNHQVIIEASSDPGQGATFATILTL